MNEELSPLYQLFFGIVLTAVGAMALKSREEIRIRLSALLLRREPLASNGPLGFILWTFPSGVFVVVGILSVLKALTRVL